jgi:superfamily I DNA and/or RNA helicase
MTDKPFASIGIIARRLNVTISNIISCLQDNGYKDVTDNPDTKITQEQYLILLKIFEANKNKTGIKNDTKNQKRLEEDIKKLSFLTSMNELLNTMRSNQIKKEEKSENVKSIENRKNDSIDKVTHLQDIWRIHTEVQENMLLLRSVPINIIAESSRIIGDKLYLTIDESNDTHKIIDDITSLFQLSSNEISIDKGYFYADSIVSQHLGKEQKKRLSEIAAANFIKFHPEPIIDGNIKKIHSPINKVHTLLKQAEFDYLVDKKGRLQVTISDLKRLKNILSDGEVNIILPENASIILPISPNPVFFLSKEFPELKIKHRTQSYKKKDKEVDEEDREILWNRTIEIVDGYFNDEVLQRLNDEIGLSLFGYDYTFKVNSDVASKYDSKTSPYILPKINPENSSFTFHTKLNESLEKDEDHLLNLYNEEKWDFNLKYTRLKNFFDFFFGSENVIFEAKFIYTYNITTFSKEYLPKQDHKKSDLWTQIYQSFVNDKISFNEKGGNIGIDFNWQNDKIEEVISRISSKCDFINFNFFKNHRCNIDFELNDLSLDEAERLLRDKFPSIITKRDNKNGTLNFYQEFQNSEQGLRLKEIIISELKSLGLNTFQYELSDVPENKEKYILEIDVQSKKESLSSVIKELRGADFCIGNNNFGKLLRVNYPEMIFDISGIEFENSKQLFESHTINSIKPNLTGDLEKIFRLKNSFNNISKGNNLRNPNLKEFIFDAAKAQKIEDIEAYINPQNETFHELEYHLLNKRINEPQKQAIIKTLLAKDLAIIQGPPGTGKSTAIAEIIWQHIRKNPKERILLTSETNLAVDNAIDRIVNSNHNLVKPIRFGDEDKLEIEGRQFSLSSMKRWVESGTIEFNLEEEEQDRKTLNQKLILLNWINNIKERAVKSNNLESTTLNLWLDALTNPTKDIRQLFYKNYVNNCNVIGATCSSIGERNSKNNPTSFFKSYCEIFGKIDSQKIRNGSNYIDYKGKLEFTTIIQDESSKATPAELSLPLTYGNKNIIIGDHRQLPPMLDKNEFQLSLDFLLDRTENKEEKRKIQKLKLFVLKHFDEMEISHFERLFQKIDSSLKGIFNLQYRMHPDINDVIKQFYIHDGGLDCGLIKPIDLGVNDPDMHNPSSRYHGIEIEGLISNNDHVIWIDTDTPEMLDGTSRVNYGEIEAIREVLIKFRLSSSFSQYQSFWNNIEDQQIGLISFYGKQIKLLQNLSKEFNDIPIRVSTVDRFQGMERNIIIVSMVRSNRIASDKNQKADFNLYGKLGFPEANDLGFAQSPNRLNVALSRAKRLLIIVGNSELFKQKEIYNNVYKTIEDKGGIRKL